MKAEIRYGQVVQAERKYFIRMSSFNAKKDNKYIFWFIQIQTIGNNLWGFLIGNNLFLLSLKTQRTKQYGGSRNIFAAN